MKSDESDLSLRWRVHDHSDVPIKVAPGPYRRFTRRLDRQLQRLIARWVHMAAPNTLRSPRFRFRSPNPK